MESFPEFDPAVVAAALSAGSDVGDFLPLLKAAGVYDVGVSWSNLSRVAGMVPSERLHAIVSQLLPALSASASADRALRNFPRFFEALSDSAAICDRIAQNRDCLDLLAQLFGFSQFMSDVLIRNTDYLDWLLENATLSAPKSAQDYIGETADALAGIEEGEERRHALCRYQQKELLRIGARDMLGRGAQAELTGELSDLAEAIVGAATDECFKGLVRRFGNPVSENGPDYPAEFGIIAMGKFGGCELNFSSDVDLIFLYTDEGMTEGLAGGEGRVSNHVFYSRLGEDLASFLSRHDSHGFLYRVDLRLRPDGESGPIVRSLGAAESYYFTQARPWERLAMIKARVICSGERFKRIFEPMATHFVYGTPTGVEIVGELADLKRRIDKQVEDMGLAGREVKRGFGGIREIEFILASFQLLHGQRQSELRCRHTLETLSAIEKRNLLQSAECEGLRDSYIFLRDVEHRLQMLDLRQTHTLPESMGQIRSLARRCGFADDGKDKAARDFLQAYAERTSFVHGIFQQIFGQADAARRTKDPTHALLDPEASRSKQFPALQPYRFTDPSILEAFHSLAFGHRDIYLSAKGQQFFEIILPHLLAESAKTPIPEQAVRIFDQFLLRFKGITGTYEFIAKQPQALGVLLHLFGACESLGRVLLSHPEFLDVAVDPETLGTLPRAESLRQRTAQLAEKEKSADKFQAALCRFKDLEFLAAGIRQVEGFADLAQTETTLTSVADACVEGALTAAGKQAAADLGSAELPGGMAVIAMGKQAIGEMNFFSDLDLVFLHEEAPPGMKDPAKFFANWAEGVVAILSEVTPAGSVFKIDVRLRPEGRNAPLAAPLGRYVDYYGSRAQVWEFQSLIRSRHAAGDAKLTAGLREAVAGPMARLSDRDDLGKEIRAMRQRLEESARVPRWARIDFKRGAGGIVDLEFILQYLQLRGFKDCPELFTPRVSDVVAGLRKHGLIDAGRCDCLEHNYRFLRLLESRSRMLFSTASSLLPEKQDKLAPLEFVMRNAIPEGASLSEFTLDTMSDNRKMFDEMVTD